MAEKSCETPKKKAKRLSHFKDAWMKEHPFLKKSRRGNSFAFCELCAADFSVGHGGYNDITRHIATDKHGGSAKAMAQSKTVSSFFPASDSKLAENVIRAEVLFTGFLVEHNISIATSDHVRPLVKKMFTDSKISESYACAATKTTHIIQGAIAPEALCNVRDCIQSQKQYFGISLDASSDQFEKYFPVLVTYEHPDTGLIVIEFLDMVACPSGRAQDLFIAVDTMLKKHNVSWNMCATYSADNAANMQGKHNSVVSRIRSAQSSKQKIYAVGCPCHLVHLMAEHAAKPLSVCVEDLIIDIYFHFQKSAKRVSTLQEYMAFCNTGVRKLVKHVKTRWLSLEKSIERTLFNWDALTSYFISTFEEDSSGLGAREKRILSSIQNPMTKVYLLFLHSVLPVFNSFNILLQTEAPMVHQLFPAMVTLYKDILVRFIQPTIIARAENIMDIDYSDPSVQLPLEDVLIGFETRNHSRRENLIDTSGFQKFARETVSFYCTALDYMKKAMPLEDPVLRSLSFVNPDLRLSSNIEDIRTITERFPNVIDQQDMDKLLNQFRDYQSCDLPVKKYLRIDEFWHQLSLIKDPVTGHYTYGVLCRLVKFVLLIPHSNASCERLFSFIRKILTDQRSSLGKNPVTQQPGPNVYESVTSVKNTLCAILASKINIFSSTPCYKWQPSPQLLKKAKSATFLALSHRREEIAGGATGHREESLLLSTEPSDAPTASSSIITEAPSAPAKRPASLITTFGLPASKKITSSSASKKKSTGGQKKGQVGSAQTSASVESSPPGAAAEDDDVVILD
ncbi:hypothetical protein GDO81_006790 [Engystomops pustulosus]|uniref:HAT C-terminal dimerisation domain-containing protein n=1 Tax=Engystomops pustulosus TaxID=76066 RepID=A0AAV7D1K1_ENGPU|nr:hypothetical protein GDO81_006790 [Engystomops pustulosus]